MARSFPSIRLRRLRRTPALRSLVRETTVDAGDLVYPVFVQPGERRKDPIASMPGQFRWSVDLLPSLVQEVAALGIGAVVLFGLPERKDEEGSEAWRHDGIVQRAIRIVKESQPELPIIADTCLDEYTTHGHCGVVVNGEIENDRTLEVLGRIAVSQAKAGADIVAPSDMMDGRVGALRRALDGAGYAHLPIMSYAAKYASAFYGPFREAADCAPQFGDRRSYQMDPGNSREALDEVALDLQEGADIVMVKPALPYLDVIRAVREKFQAPVAAFNVSGEYAMVKSAAELGRLDERAAVLETLMSIKRSGADIILTYHACEAARWLREGVQERQPAGISPGSPGT